MASENQIRANRRNARLSTGPRTEAGMEASSSNHTKHGLTGRRVVLKSENQAEYDELLAALLQDYAPQSAIEVELVHEIANNSWRLRRADRVEAELFDLFEDDFLTVAGELDKIRRYRTAIEKAWHKAIDQLRKIQAARPAKEHDQKPCPDPVAALDKALRDCVFARNGFESQNGEEDEENEEEQKEEAVL